VTDVLIVGAGPAGLLLAGELRLANVGTVVIEPTSATVPARKTNGILQSSQTPPPAAPPRRHLPAATYLLPHQPRQ
jgi:thioredoxin reductase